MTRHTLREPAAIASAVLALFYAWVGYVALHPHVSPEYAAYYVHRTSALTISEQRTVVPLVVGETYSVAVSIVAFDGWLPWDGMARRSARRDPAIIFLVSEPVAQLRDLSLHLELVEPLGLPVAATLNRTPVAVRSSNSQLDIDLGFEAFRPGENAVALSLPRSVALALVSLGLVVTGRGHV